MARTRRVTVKRQVELLATLEAAFGIDIGKENYSSYAHDPIGFIENELGEFLTDQQKAIANSVKDFRETNVQAAHGVGKSFLSSRLVIWWVVCVGGLAITTAPTARQVNQILWAEIRRIHGKLKLPGELGQTFLRISEEARAFGFTASSTNSNAFQGIHYDKLLVIEDEACGISDEIDDGASSCATGANNRLLRVGNPILTDTSFEKACARRHIRIPVWDHPNVSWAYHSCDDGIHRLKPDVESAILDENGEVLPQSAWNELPRDRIPGAVSIPWIEDVRRKHGEASAFWASRVEGFFPSDSEASIIPRSWFKAARTRYDENPNHWDALSSSHKFRFGLDVGDGGDDHGLARWRGPVLYSVAVQATKGDREDVTRAAGWALRESRAHYDGAISVDHIGVGSGALAILKEQGISASGVNWGGAAKNSSQFANCKAEDFWLLREAFRNGEIALAPLGEIEEMLMADLSGTYYEETSTGKIKIEDKKLTRKRLHRSPNAGDAVVYGFRKAITLMPDSLGLTRRR